MKNQTCVCVGAGVYENSVLFAQFCSEPKPTLKNSMLKKKQTEKRVKDNLLCCYTTLSENLSLQNQSIHAFCLFLWKINFLPTKFWVLF